jgi:hypothetical protein
MLRFLENNTSETFVVTLTEKTTLSPVHYLFVFTHVTEKSSVSFVLSTDESLYPERFNQFTINIPVRFAGAPVGQYHYRVFEQSSAENTDPEGLTEVERGRMNLIKAEPFEFTEYNETTTFKTYAG